MACRASCNSTGSRSTACAFSSAYSARTLSNSIVCDAGNFRNLCWQRFILTNINRRSLPVDFVICHAGNANGDDAVFPSVQPCRFNVDQILRIVKHIAAHDFPVLPAGKCRFPEQLYRKISTPVETLILKADKVLTPSSYKALQGIKSPNKKPKDPYD